MVVREKSVHDLFTFLRLERARGVNDGLSVFRNRIQDFELQVGEPWKVV